MYGRSDIYSHLNGAHNPTEHDLIDEVFDDVYPDDLYGADYDHLFLDNSKAFTAGPRFSGVEEEEQFALATDLKLAGFDDDEIYALVEEEFGAVGQILGGVLKGAALAAKGAGKALRGISKGAVIAAKGTGKVLKGAGKVAKGTGKVLKGTGKVVKTVGKGTGKVLKGTGKVVKTVGKGAGKVVRGAGKVTSGISQGLENVSDRRKSRKGRKGGRKLLSTRDNSSLVKKAKSEGFNASDIKMAKEALRQMKEGGTAEHWYAQDARLAADLGMEDWEQPDFSVYRANPKSYLPKGARFGYEPAFDPSSYANEYDVDFNIYPGRYLSR